MSTYVSTVRNVNEAYAHLMRLAYNPSLWREVSPRGMATKEFRGTFITEYQRPVERVLFDEVRDANPFFHFMEALWIMAGRDDVAFLNQFNSNIGTYSDDGVTFNAPYGHRLRKHFERLVNHPSGEFVNGNEIMDAGFETLDQIAEVIELLRGDPNTRRAVLCLWDPVKDLNRESKDIPCNDLVTFKLRDGVLDMTVMNRSNDAMWGAYGANAVQFSVLHEFVALAVVANVGVYRQISDSLHMYTSQETWKKCFAAEAARTEPRANPYVDKFGRTVMSTYPLMAEGGDWRLWLRQCADFLDGTLAARHDHATIMPFFIDVAAPIWEAWLVYKNITVMDKNDRIVKAQDILLKRCMAEDWASACAAWLTRRVVKTIEPWGKDRV